MTGRIKAVRMILTLPVCLNLFFDFAPIIRTTQLFAELRGDGSNRAPTPPPLHCSQQSPAVRPGLKTQGSRASGAEAVDRSYCLSLQTLSLCAILSEAVDYGNSVRILNVLFLYGNLRSQFLGVRSSTARAREAEIECESSKCSTLTKLSGSGLPRGVICNTTEHTTQPARQ